MTMPVLGMTCANCVASVERNAKKVDGVSDAVVNFASEKVALSYDPALTEPQEVIDEWKRAMKQIERFEGIVPGAPAASDVGRTFC